MTGDEKTSALMDLRLSVDALGCSEANANEAYEDGFNACVDEVLAMIDVLLNGGSEFDVRWRRGIDAACAERFGDERWWRIVEHRPGFADQERRMVDRTVRAALRSIPASLEADNAAAL